MSDRHFFVSDLDGTLLRRDATLSARTRDALVSMMADGLLFTVASARPVPSIRTILTGLPLSLPVVELNGVFVSDLASGRHVAVHAPEPEVGRELLACILARGHAVFAVTMSGDEDHLYFADLPNPAMVWYRDEKIALGDPRLREVGSLTSIPRAETIVSFALLGPRDAMRDLEAELHESFPTSIQTSVFENVYCPGWWEMTIQDRRATKSYAIAELRRHLGFEAHRLTVFGDNLNDMDMFRGADRTVAVLNAVDALRAEAHHVTSSNDDDGVVEWLLAMHRAL